MVKVRNYIISYLSCCLCIISNTYSHLTACDYPFLLMNISHLYNQISINPYLLNYSDPRIEMFEINGQISIHRQSFTFHILLGSNHRLTCLVSPMYIGIYVFVRIYKFIKFTHLIDICFISMYSLKNVTGFMC